MKHSKNILALALSALILSPSCPSRIEARPQNSIGIYKQSSKVVNLLNKARKSVSRGKMQDAINSYWKVLELDSSEPYAYLEMGELYKNLRIYDRSIEMLTTGLDLAEKLLDPETLCNYYCVLTEVYMITNQQGLANKSLIKSAEVSPRNPMPRKILGDIYLKNNRLANAAKAYKKALELDPHYQPAILALRELGDLPKEKKVIKIAKTQGNIKREEKKAENFPKTEAKLKEKEESPIVEAKVKEANIDRPLPMKAEEMPKPKPKPRGKEKAVKEALDNPQRLAEIKEENERQIDIFLTGNPKAKEEAINYFVNQGKRGLAEIEELIYDPDPVVRILAARALPLFNDYKKEVIAILEDASDDSDPEVVEEIANILASMK